jgi:hypothetical protein
MSLLALFFMQEASILSRRSSKYAKGCDDGEEEDKEEVNNTE